LTAQPRGVLHANAELAAQDRGAIGSQGGANGVSIKKRKLPDMKETVLPRLEQYLTRKPRSSPIWACFSRYGPTSPHELHKLAICELCTKAEIYCEFKTKNAMEKHLLHFHPPQWEVYKASMQKKENQKASAASPETRAAFAADASRNGAAVGAVASVQGTAVEVKLADGAWHRGRLAARVVRCNLAIAHK